MIAVRELAIQEQITNSALNRKCGNCLAIFDDAFDDYGALDSLYENDMLESVPVASGEQSNYEQALAARRTYKRKQSQRASAPSRGSAVVAVASWRRVR